MPIPALHVYEIGWPLSAGQQTFASRTSDAPKSTLPDLGGLLKKLSARPVGMSAVKFPNRHV